MTTIDEQLLNFHKSDVFTPDSIAKLMGSKLHNCGNVLEPSVGTGNLIRHLNQSMYDNIDVYEIKQQYLENIEGTKINKYCADFLKTKIERTYDNIILNPPYIRVQDLSIDYRNYIKQMFPLLKNGMTDIYYAFILKCLQLLTPNGKMVSITPNSYLYNKSALKLRKYLFDNQLIDEIIDFKSTKVFDGLSVYCCITVYTKTNKEYFTYNDKKMYYNDVDKTDYNIFQNNTSNPNIQTLGDICKIKNGIATLRDKIYIHDTKLFDEPCWQPISTSKTVKYIIFPYHDNGAIMTEDELKNTNPNTFNFLMLNKDELSKRDKGNKTYPKWYAFGRSQSLIKPTKNKVIYIPAFLNPADFQIEASTPALFYNCLCIEPNTEELVDTILQTIKKNSEMLSNISTKRGGGWINISNKNLYKLPVVT